MSWESAIVVALNVTSICVLVALSLKAFRNSRKELIAPVVVPKARILSLRVECSRVANGKVLQENTWIFEEPYVEHAINTKGERMLCGYTDRELNEISRRRSEWGL